MPDDEIYSSMVNSDAFLATLMGGMARAQERFSAKLRTVDENGNPIDEKEGDPKCLP